MPHQVRGLPDGLGVGGRGMGGPIAARLRRRRRRQAVVEHVAGDLKEDRPAAPRHGEAQGRVEHLGNAVGPRDLHRHLGHGAEHADEVEFLERVLVGMLRGDAADEDDDGRVRDVGRGDAGEQIGRARAARHEADAGRAGDAREPVRHERGSLLVAAVDVLDRLVVVEGVEHVEERRPDDAEDVAHLLGLQELDDGPSPREIAHGGASLPRTIRDGTPCVMRSFRRAARCVYGIIPGISAEHQCGGPMPRCALRGQQAARGGGRGGARARPHEVRVKWAANGVCHSDLHVMTGDYPHPLPVVLGHEAAGVVEQRRRRASSRCKAGDHVCSSYIPSCGRCWYCLSSLPTMCALRDKPRWFMLDGTRAIPEGRAGHPPFPPGLRAMPRIPSCRRTASSRSGRTRRSTSPAW